MREHRVLQVQIRLTLLLLFSVVGCSSHDDLTRKQAEALINSASALEAQGHVLQAYRQYSLVGNNVSHGDRALVSRGLENAGRLAQIINAACTPADSAIKKFRERNGVHPKSLDDLIVEIPTSSKQAFSEFRLVNFADGTVGIDCGLYGPVNEFPE